MKNVHQQKRCTNEECAPIKNEQPLKMWTNEKCAPLKNVHQWKMCTNEKYAPMQNMHQCGILRGAGYPATSRLGPGHPGPEALLLRHLLPRPRQPLQEGYQFSFPVLSHGHLIRWSFIRCCAPMQCPHNFSGFLCTLNTNYFNIKGYTNKTPILLTRIGILIREIFLVLDPFFEKDGIWVFFHR